MRELALHGGKVALIDDVDYDSVSQWSNWRQNTKGTVERPHYTDGVRSYMTLSRFIMNPHEGLQVDHIDRNQLNNQRSNLRNVTRSVNCLNRGSCGTNVTGYHGVSICKKGAKRIRFRARVIKLRITIFSVVKDTAREAYEARQEFLRKEGLIL